MRLFIFGGGEVGREVWDVWSWREVGHARLGILVGEGKWTCTFWIFGGVWAGEGARAYVALLIAFDHYV